MFDNGGVEHESAMGVAQHYQLPTFLVDWTWNPFVALAFAMSDLRDGEEGVVFLRDFGDGTNPTSDYNVLLPPSFAKRAWRQRAFFSWHPVAPEDWDNPVVQRIAGDIPRHNAMPNNYYHIKFRATESDIKWAKQSYAGLMKEDLPGLGCLAKWCLEAARKGANGPLHPNVLSLDDFQKWCNRCNLNLPEFVVTNREVEVTENFALMMDYIDEMSVRRNPSNGTIGYFIPSVLTACVGMPWNSCMKYPARGLKNLNDPRADVFFDDDGQPCMDHWHKKLSYMKSLVDIRRIQNDDFFRSMFVERPRGKRQQIG